MEIPATKVRPAVIQEEVNQDVADMRELFAVMMEYTVALKAQLVT